MQPWSAIRLIRSLPLPFVDPLLPPKGWLLALSPRLSAARAPATAATVASAPSSQLALFLAPAKPPSRALLRAAPVHGMTNKSYLAFLDDQTTKMARTKVPGLSALPTLIPHRVRRKWRATRSRIRSRQSPTSSIASLETSFSPADTLRSLRTHPWSIYDGQYLLLAIVLIFSLSVSESPGPFAKTFIATLLMGGLVLPITRQFLLPFLPALTWLLLFSSCKYIPSDYRPAIWVRVLPALENILYGANLSNILSAHKHPVLDIMAWIPYGVMHYVSPVLVSGAMFIWGPPGTLPTWARAFGYMNMTAVIIQILFPCSPPWYENLYGLAPANYSVKGDAAGLKAIDQLLGIDLYTSGFKASPVVFGAFPSLHSGFATLETLFIGHLFPKLFPYYICYCMWMWWATMYFSHHYAVDLVAGSLRKHVPSNYTNTS
jgi:hypothetical protein